MVKISEVIDKLTKIKEEYGDIAMVSPEFDSWGSYDVDVPEQINLHKAKIVNKNNIRLECDDIENVTAFSITTWDSSENNNRIIFDYKANEELPEIKRVDVNSDKGILNIVRASPQSLTYITKHGDKE